MTGYGVIYYCYYYNIFFKVELYFGKKKRKNIWGHWKRIYCQVTMTAVLIRMSLNECNCQKLLWRWSYYHEPWGCILGDLSWLYLHVGHPLSPSCHHVRPAVVWGSFSLSRTILDAQWHRDQTQVTATNSRDSPLVPLMEGSFLMRVSAPPQLLSFGGGLEMGRHSSLTCRVTKSPECPSQVIP